MLRAGRARGTRSPTSTCTSPTARSSSTTSRSRSSRCTPATPHCAPPAARSATRVIADLDEAGLAAASRSIRRSWRTTTRLRLRRRRVAAALLHRLLPAAQPLRDAGRDALLEGRTRTACKHHARHRAVGAASRSPTTAREWQRAAQAADARARWPASRCALDYTASDKVRTIDFRGYAYTRTPSDVSGALMTRYDETKPQVWKLPLRDDVQPAASSPRRAPATSCPPRMRRGSARSCDVHGIAFRTLDRALDQPRRADVPRDEREVRRQLGRRPPAPDARRRRGSRRRATSARARCSCRSRSRRRAW